MIQMSTGRSYAFVSAIIPSAPDLQDQWGLLPVTLKHIPTYNAHRHWLPVDKQRHSEKQFWTGLAKLLVAIPVAPAWMSIAIEWGFRFGIGCEVAHRRSQRRGYADAGFI